MSQMFMFKIAENGAQAFFFLFFFPV